MNKILVIGCPGSGKSTFSKALGGITGVPLFHLDMLYWNEDKTTVPREVFLQRLSKVLNQSSWIIDGNYASTMELRISYCDTIFFLDFSKDVCLSGIEDRKGKKRSDLPWVEPFNDDQEFLDFINSFNSQSRPKIMELLDKYSDKSIFIFKTRSESDLFLSKLKSNT